jgi:hypothetical protein
MARGSKPPPSATNTVGCPCSSRIAAWAPTALRARAAPVSMVALANISGLSRRPCWGPRCVRASCGCPCRACWRRRSRGRRSARPDRRTVTVAAAPTCTLASLSSVRLASIHTVERSATVNSGAQECPVRRRGLLLDDRSGQGAVNAKVEAPGPCDAGLPAGATCPRRVRRSDDAFSSSDLARRSSRCGMISWPATPRACSRPARRAGWIAPAAGQTVLHQGPGCRGRPAPDRP